MIEAAGHSSIPFPIFVGIFFIVMFVIGQLKPKKPTQVPTSDRTAQAERLKQLQPANALPVPNAARRRKQKNRAAPPINLQAAAMAAEKAARTQATTRAVAVDKASDAQAPRMPAKPPTIASNARTYFQRGGLRDAFILSEVLGPPKSAQ